MRYAEFAHKILLEAMMPGFFNAMRGFGRATMYGLGRGASALGQGAGLGGAMRTGLNAGRMYGRAAVGTPMRRAGLTRTMMGAAKTRKNMNPLGPGLPGTGGTDKFATGLGLGVAGVGLIKPKPQQRPMM